MSRPAAKAVAAVMDKDCVAIRIRLINRVVSGIFDSALRPFDLKASQVNILAVVARLGQAEPAAICDALQLDKSTLSRNTGRMKKKGWLETVRSPGGRGKAFTLTDAGAELLVRIFPAWREAQERASRLLGKEGMAASARMAEAVNAGGGR